MNAAFPDWIEQLAWTDDGLVPVVTQDASSGRLLTQAWMNREALARTAREGLAIYWSRSRQQLWQKGEQSGHVQRVREIRLDCDNDSLLLIVDQQDGIACHTGRESCFFQRLDLGKGIEQARWCAVDPVLKNPEEIYRK